MARSKASAERSSGHTNCRCHIAINESVNNREPAERRKRVDEIRVAYHEHGCYYVVLGLSSRLLDALDLTDTQWADGLIGLEVEKVIEAHDQAHVVCSVLEQSGQQQCGRNKAFKKTTIGILTPGSELLAVRAFDADSEADTLGAITEKAGKIPGEPIDDSRFKREFAALCVDEYWSLEITTKNRKFAVGSVTMHAALNRETGTALDDLGDSVAESGHHEFVEITLTLV